MRIKAAAAILCMAVIALTATAGEAKTVTFQHSVNMVVEYPQVGVESIDQQVREWLEERLAETVAGMAGVAIDPDMEDGDDGITVEYALERPSDRALSVVFRTSSFPFKAAHPTARTDVLSFDLRSGGRLTMDRMFQNPDAALAYMATHARARIAESLVRTNGDQIPADLADDDDYWFVDGFQPTQDNYAALALVPGGVRVIFQQYQVLPYAFGMPTVFFSLDELDPAGPDLALWENSPPLPEHN
ncbi:MAG: RsiV family protein [Planctomycetaceae bacterium]|nr:RsiV family protein [Planctomycetaceae bacterium]